MHNIFVSQLHIYPVKSLRGISVESLSLTNSGPDFDRKWMVVSPNGKFLTQRVLPKMCLINTALNNGVLTLSHSGLSPVEVPAGGGRAIEVTVWRDTVSAEDCGDEIAGWLSAALGKECRMVFMPSGNERIATKRNYQFSSLYGFADGYPLLLASESSLAEFNTYLTRPVGMDRFRPNVVVRGSSAFAEDHWQEINIDSHSFILTSPCTRCAVPSIDQATAEKEQQVLDTLNTHRRFDKETRFGQNVVYQHESTIAVGHKVEIVR